MTIKGGCFCGAVRYEAETLPRRVTHCHCLHCRRTSGAPFLTWAEFNPEHFRIVKGTPGSCESRPHVKRQFCAACGTQLTYEHLDEPGTVDVTVASFDTPDEIAPEDHVWCDRMLPWLHFRDDLPRYALSRFPPTPG